ncbi:MAG: IS110 family transposase, partial [Chloroflexi bacterium]
TGPYSTCLREWLLSAGLRVVQVNPYHVKRTKEVRDNNPGKSDGKDPGVIADLVWQGCYQEVRPLAGVYAELRAASGEWAALSKKRTALRNEFQGLLEVWFPELRDCFVDVVGQSVRALVRRYDSVQAMAEAGEARLRRVLDRASRGQTRGRAAALWEACCDSVAPTAGQQARHRHLCCLLDILEMVEQRQDQLQQEMAAWLEQVPEARFLLSAPGVGTVSATGLLGECGDLGGYASYGSLEKHLGLDLYEISSGKQQGRRRISKRGRSLARYLLCQIVLGQLQRAGLYYDFAQELKKKGKKGREIRVAAARKLLRLLYALARTRTEYIPQRFVSGNGTGDGLLNHLGTPASIAA